LGANPDQLPITNNQLPKPQLQTSTKTLLPALITAAVAFLVYLLTLEPDLTWANFGGDGGELITAAVTLGVPHPPGYPTYVLIGKLFSYIPIGTVAYRFNLLSGLCTAVSAGFVAGIVYRLRPAINGRATGERPINRAWEGDVFRGFIPAVSAGLAFSFSSLVWGQAVIAEVYALNLVFVGAFHYFLLCKSNWLLDVQFGKLHYDESNRPFDTRFAKPVVSAVEPSRYSFHLITFMTGLLLGLSITTHLTSFLLLPLALLLTPFRRWFWLFPGFLTGLLPFLLLPLLAQSGSPVVWSRPDTLEGWWWLVSAQLYRPNVFGLPSPEWPVRLAEWSRLFLEQLAYGGVPLLLVGFFGRIKTYRRLLTGLTATTLLYIIYAFTYNTFDAAVLLLPALFLLSVILGFGLQYLGRAAIILPLALLWLNLSQPEPGYWTINQAAPVRSAADTLLATVPAEAILLTPGDPTLTAMWYFHHVEGKRPDIIIIDGNLFQFTWYREQLGRDYPFLQHLAQDDLPGFIEQNRQSRPLCETSLIPPGDLEC
jgi:hypothetical protein